MYREEELEEATLDWFQELDYSTAFGPKISPDGVYSERNSYDEIILKDRLKTSLQRINPDIPLRYIDKAISKLITTDSPDLIESNKMFHEMVTEGVSVETDRDDDFPTSIPIWLFDFEDPDNNDWLVVNQFTVIEHDHNRRPDIVVFINGLPLSVFELKSSSDERATLERAYNQFQTYKNDIRTLFKYNTNLITSDGITARVGTLTSSKERFMPWKTIEGKKVAPQAKPQLEVLIKGIFDKERFLDLLKHFVLFQSDNGTMDKIFPAYHQYYAVNKAYDKTEVAVQEKSDNKIGVVWHTQGSGKSILMVFYSGKLVLGLDNPTIVVITDRNDLDDQLFQTFSSSEHLLRQTPKQAGSRENLKELLNVESGGIIFTTIQKFEPDPEDPVLTDRKNVIVIADEAHRSQYGFSAKVKKQNNKADIKYGYAKYMRDSLPNASFIGFTATPIEFEDKNTPAVFGNYIDIYDMTQSVEDNMTVRIYYESRIAQVRLPEEKRKLLDEKFEEIAEIQDEIDEEKKQRIKSKWSKLESIVGAKERLELIAEETINHFKKRQEAIKGKGMVVTMSRRIAVELYKEFINIKSEWHSEDDDKGKIKVVMSGGSDDPEDWQQHIRTKQQRKTIKKRFKDPEDPLEIVIVCSMWLTGFDVPCLHTMYIDKPMKGHTLMQAIARVNRVYGDKPGGLIVDYIGIADSLRKALQAYTESDRENTGIDTDKAVKILLEKYEVIKDMFHGFDYKEFFEADSKRKMGIITEAIDFILENREEGKKRFIKHVKELSKVYALCATHEKAEEIADEIGFFKSVKSGIVKITSTETSSDSKELEPKVKQLISKSVVTDGVVDIFESTDLNKPDLSILSDEFLEEVRNMEQKNVAEKVLEKIIKGKIRTISRKNVVKSRKFSEMLNETVSKYQNRAIDTKQVIEELIRLAKEIDEAQDENRDLDLNEDEIAFYDALSTNDSAVEVLGDEILKNIATELTESIKSNLTIDWNLRESIQAEMRVIIKRLLRKYNYPPDDRKEAIKTVMEQAENMCKREEDFG